MLMFYDIPYYAYMSIYLMEDKYVFILFSAECILVQWGEELPALTGLFKIVVRISSCRGVPWHESSRAVINKVFQLIKHFLIELLKHWNAI